VSSLVPESPEVGSLIELMRAGERQQLGTAMVRAVDGPLLVLGSNRLPDLAGSLTLRWWDDDDEAWEVTASLERSDPSGGELTLRIVDAWKPAVLRRAARVEIDRAPVDLITIGGDGREVRRVTVSCLDLSTTGCRVAGAGSQPSRGDVFVVTAATRDVVVRIDAQVVHVAPISFGGWQVGLEFLPHTANERALLVAWRDSANSV
jgi:PilZ domain